MVYRKLRAQPSDLRGEAQALRRDLDHPELGHFEYQARGGIGYGLRRNVDCNHRRKARAGRKGGYN
jgi:hypothetical protein